MRTLVDHPYIGLVQPGQMRSRRTGLLTPPRLLPAPIRRAPCTIGSGKHQHPGKSSTGSGAGAFATFRAALSRQRRNAADSTSVAAAGATGSRTNSPVADACQTGMPTAAARADSASHSSRPAVGDGG